MYKTIVLALSFSVLTGCINTNSLFIPKISEEEAFMVENEYLLSMNKNKKYTDMEEMEVWVQPENKTIPCKICVVTTKDDDITKSIGYKAYWDGSCKNGYAYGLGREFSQNATRSNEEIALYSGKKERMQTFSFKDHTPGSFRKYIKDEDDKKIIITGLDREDNGEIYEKYLQVDKEKNNILIVAKNLVTNSYDIRTGNINGYFFYHLIFSPNSSNGVVKEFSIKDKNTGEIKGFISIQLNDRSWKHFRIKDNKIDSEVKMPESRNDLISSIEKDTNDLINKSINIKQQSNSIVERYKRMITSGEVKNNFMNEEEYRNILYENKEMNNVKEEIEKKIQALNERIQQERLIRAREQEALAAQRQAEAAEASVFSSSINNSNLQNTNMQLQNLNQQLMYLRMGL